MHTVNHHVGQRGVALDIKVSDYGGVATNIDVLVYLCGLIDV